jgi:hypothetical protein
LKLFRIQTSGLVQRLFDSRQASGGVGGPSRGLLAEVVNLWKYLSEIEAHARGTYRGL